MVMQLIKKKKTNNKPSEAFTLTHIWAGTQISRRESLKKSCLVWPAHPWSADPTKQTQIYRLSQAAH